MTRFKAANDAIFDRLSPQAQEYYRGASGCLRSEWADLYYARGLDTAVELIEDLAKPVACAKAELINLMSEELTTAAELAEQPAEEFTAHDQARIAELVSRTLHSLQVLAEEEK